MERLQQAIEKARMDRAREREGGALEYDKIDPVFAAPSARLTQDGGNAAWDALPLHVVTPRQLNANRLIGARSDVNSVRIDILRTRLQQQMRSNDWTRIMVTSPTPGCGKSTLICNLAFSLLRQQDRRVLVLDFDLRRPGIGKILGIPDNLRPGIGAVLSGAVPLGASAVRLGDQVAVCAAKAGPESMPELLKSQATREMIQEIQQEYSIDMILFDVPPIFANDDAMAVAEMADCGVIVAAAGQTSVDQIDRAERELSQYTQVAGVVANKLQFEENADSTEYY